MAARKPLRAVELGERPEQARPLTLLEAALTLLEAAEAGDRLAELKAMRVILARALPGASPRDMASISRRQIEIGREIEALEIAEGEESVIAGTSDEAWDSSAI